MGQKARKSWGAGTGPGQDKWIYRLCRRGQSLAVYGTVNGIISGDVTASRKWPPREQEPTHSTQPFIHPVAGDTRARARLGTVQFKVLRCLSSVDLFYSSCVTTIVTAGTQGLGPRLLQAAIP